MEQISIQSPNQSITQLIKHSFYALDKKNFLHDKINLITEPDEHFTPNIVDTNNDYVIVSLKENIWNKELSQIKSTQWFELDNFSNVKKTPRFELVIVIVELDDEFNIENLNYLQEFESKHLEHIDLIKHNLKTIANNVILCPLYVSKAIEYTTIVFDDVCGLGENILDKILKDEYGKQGLKKFNTIEKKQHEVKQISERDNVADEWFRMVGINKLFNVVKLELIEKYDNIIFQHALIQLKKLHDDIFVNNDNDTSVSQYEKNLNLLKLFLQIIKLFGYDKNFLMQIITKNFNINKNEEGEKIVNIKNESKVDTTSFINLIEIFNKIKEFVMDYNPVEMLNQTQIDNYLCELNNFIDLFGLETDINICTKRNFWIKNKLLFSFDSDIFIKMFESNQIDINFFKECIEFCISNNLNNFNTLINFIISNSNKLDLNSDTYLEIIIDKLCENKHTNNFYYSIGYKINFDDFIETFKNVFGICVENLNLDSNPNPNTILLAKLMFEIIFIGCVDLTMNDNNNNNNNNNDNNDNDNNVTNKLNLDKVIRLVSVTKNIFERIFYNNTYKINDDYNLFLQNLHYNYSIILEQTCLLLSNTLNISKSIDYTTFIQTNKLVNNFVDIIHKKGEEYLNNKSKINVPISNNDTEPDDLSNEIRDKAILCLNKNDSNENESDSEQSDTDSHLNQSPTPSPIKNLCSNSDSESNSNSNSKSNSESDSESDSESESESNEIEKVFNLIKTTKGCKTLNHNILRTMAKNYYTIGKNYTKSIELFKKELDAKTFSKKYKALNK